MKHFILDTNHLGQALQPSAALHIEINARQRRGFRFGEMYRFATAKGRALSQVDLMLAAMARLHGLILLSADKDFAAFPDLRVENWL
jgi:predicted nucleic acid-binding protein